MSNKWNLEKQSHILSVCQQGFVRSVAFLYQMHSERGYKEIINCGIECIDAGTFLMLARWADHIFVCGDENLWRLIPATVKAKATLVNVGPDIWHDSDNPDLQKIMRKKVAEMGL